MDRDRFCKIISGYDDLKIVIIGDFCLDRYFEIDPSLSEISVETGLEVHNVVRVRSQPGAAGTILNNLVALGVGEIIPIGFRGNDAEGWLLEKALREKKGVRMDCFLRTEDRVTFTYSKPLIIESGKSPRELHRLDQKNWSRTPDSVSDKLVSSIEKIAEEADAMIVMDQVDLAETGVLTRQLLECLEAIGRRKPKLPIIADSRRGLAHYPPLSFKMNAHECQMTLREKGERSLLEMRNAVEEISFHNHRPAFVTMAEAGIVGANPGEEAVHLPAFSVKGEIDIVGAGDAVTANLASALAAGANINEAMKLSMAAASIVIHKLGTTGTASCDQLFAKMQF